MSIRWTPGVSSLILPCTIACPSVVSLHETIDLFVNARLIHPENGTSYDLAGISILGRGAGCSVTIPQPNVSRRHAMIREQSDGFWFFDLGSRNGSSLNGKRVTTAQVLENGDIVAIGNQELRFEGSVPSGGGMRHTTADQTIVEIQSRNAIILVSDIRDFTSLSERLRPDQLAPIIGTWYAEIERVLEEHGATLDKFIGDSVLAYWLDTSHPSRLAALKTAHAMQKTCDQVQHAHHQELDDVGLDFRTGAAIHLGPASYGAFSAGGFTLIGDAVNLTFRLEALTRGLGKRILVSSEFLDSWDAGGTLCQSCGFKQVKGRAEAVEVFSLEVVPA